MNNRAIEIIERKYGDTSKTPTATSPVTIATSSTTIISARADGKRKWVTIQNNGTEPVIISLGNAASVTNYQYTLKDCTAGRDGLGASITLENYQGAVYGIVEANSSVVSVLEMLSE